MPYLQVFSGLCCLFFCNFLEFLKFLLTTLSTLSTKIDY